MVEKRVNKFGKVSSTPHPLLSGKKFFYWRCPLIEIKQNCFGYSIGQKRVPGG